METERKEIDIELVKSLMDNSYNLISVNYTDNMNDHSHIFRQCLEERSANPLQQHFNDWFTDSESRIVDDVIDHLKERIINAGYKRWEAEKFMEENEDEVRDEIYSRGEYDGVEDVLKYTSDIPVRVKLISNHDCINSHWFESNRGGFSYEESYFGDMINALNLNPRKVKRLLASCGEKTCGRFPNRRNRNGNEYVTYDQFFQEHINSSSPANLLTFMAKINPLSLYESDFDFSRLTIPKGNECGLFSSTYGGGSVLEMVLQRDMTIDLTRKEYPYYRLEIESDGKDYDYSIWQVYGIDNSAYGQPVRIELAPANERIPA